MTARLGLFATALLVCCGLLASGCGHSFQEVANASLKTSLEAAGATTELTIQASESSQRAVVEELEAAVAKLSPADPDREVKVAALQGVTREKVATIRAARDKTLLALTEAYSAIVMASVLLPLVEKNQARHDEVVQLLIKTAAAIERARAP